MHGIGDTYGLKLVIDTSCIEEHCKLCAQNEKQQMQHEETQRDVKRWGNNAE